MTQMKHSTWWWISAAVSSVLVVVLINLWVHMNNYNVEPTQLVDAQATDAYLKDNWEGLPSQAGSTIKIKTGIFIQSLQFFNSTEVNLSGYIWQRYQDGVHDAIKPKPGEIGFILPEQVNSGSDI